MTSQSVAKPHFVIRNDGEWERVVIGEVLIPGVPNVFGDYWTTESIREAMYAFMQEGFGIDVEHDNVDVTGGVSVIECFQAREGDTEFIPGSWVVGMHIADEDLWARVLAGDINGFSYEALVSFTQATLVVDDDGTRQGTTSPAIEDGHTHEFAVLVGEDNRPISGGTSTDHGHSHTITKHTVTDEAAGHVHRYTLVQGKDGK